jgi:hypothetical protein
MERVFASLAYWCGCVAIVVVAIGLLAVPSNLAIADSGAGPNVFAGQCPQDDKGMCTEVGKECTNADNLGTCKQSQNGSNCTCKSANGTT